MLLLEGAEDCGMLHVAGIPWPGCNVRHRTAYNRLLQAVGCCILKETATCLK